MCANLSVLMLTGRAHGHEGTHLQHHRSGLSGGALGHEDLLLQCRHPGGHECLGQGHEPGCTGAVSIITEEVSPGRGPPGWEPEETPRAAVPLFMLCSGWPALSSPFWNKCSRRRMCKC